MHVSIVNRPPASSALHCYFYGQLPFHADRSVARPPAKQSKWYWAGDEALCFGQSQKALRWFESEEALRVMGGTAWRKAVQNGSKELAWHLDGNVSDADFELLVQGAFICSYRFDSYKGKVDPPSTRKLVINAGSNMARFRKLLPRLEAIAQGMATCRDLANLPPNELPPFELAARAKAVAKETGLVYKEVSFSQLQRDGYVGLTAVGGGSINPPVLFTLQYRPERAAEGARPVCLVGKGITFDTGGISIKPWDGMWDMKADMSGAACVVGAMHAIALLKPPVPVVAIVASAENMPDGKAYRPGDVLRFRNGRTVEIRSTDAEGRLVLADALIYAQETLKQRRIIDFATLTGACARALGNPFIGLMSRNPGWAAEVAEAGRRSGDSTWELPLALEYRPLIDSSVADIMNSGGPLAGAQTAGWFLQEFIEDGTEYVHLDIAGTFLASKADKYYGQPGATGTGVRLAVALAEASAG
jgi:leucyl aminopeptidase